MGKKMRFYVGDHVRFRSTAEINKLGIHTHPEDIDYLQDIGVILQITEKKDGKDIVMVRWKHMDKELIHQSSILIHIGAGD
jgi:hypothetical protein